MHNKEPDVVVSLGTGVSKKYGGTLEEASTETLLQSRFLPRLFRSFMVLLDGQRTWHEFWNSLPLDARDRYHRLNTEFDGPEPQLDDIRAMSDLEQQTKTSAVTSNTLTPCADNLIASLFYLELDGYPIFDKSVFRCRAHICCRWSSNNLALLRLASRMAKTETRFYVNGRVYTGVDELMINELNNRQPFRRPVEFEVSHLNDLINVSVAGVTTRPRNISNCPYVLASLIQDQGLECVFGREDHQKRKRLVPADGEPHQGRSHKRRNLRSDQIWGGPAI